MSDTHEIHSDVPLPKRRAFGGVVRNWPFQNLHVGQCFYVDALKGTAEGKTTENSVRTSSSREGRGGKRFTVRRIDADRLGVWRVE